MSCRCSTVDCAALNGATCAVAVAPAGFASQPRPFARTGVGYDGSAESFNALATARELAAVNGSKIHLLQVVLEPLLAYTNYVGPEVSTTIDDLLQETRNQLVQLPDVETHAMYGAAGEKLAEFSQEVDILVIGSRGYGPLHRLMAGSTCDYLQHHAYCPLLVMPRSATTKPDDVVIMRPKDAPVS
jgi:nucleotide-binding universal stress UspA family protein